LKTIDLDSHRDILETAGKAVDIISEGGIVLVPTETQYGLCVNAESEESLLRLWDIKQQGPSSPSAIFVESLSNGESLLKDKPEGIDAFLKHFWPGPLTLVAQSERSHWPGIVTEKGTIGLRCSSHDLIREMARLSGNYLTATSANVHREVPPTSRRFLTKWLEGRVELLIFDSSVRPDAPASTVMDISGGTLNILRVGDIAPEVIMTAWRKEIRRER